MKQARVHNTILVLFSVGGTCIRARVVVVACVCLREVAV